MTLLDSVAPLLEAALRRSGEGLTLEDVAAEVGAGRVWLVCGERSAVAVKPDGLDFHIWLAGGDLDELMDIEAALEVNARAAGFTRMTGGGVRRGWHRVLKHRGWKADGLDFVKEL